MVKTKGFKPQELGRDDQLKTTLMRRAKYKTDLLEEARIEALRYAPVSDLKAFSDDFVAYTTKHILNENEAFRGLNISTSKMLQLLEYDLSYLANIQIQFEQNIAEVLWDKKGMPYTEVIEADYTSYTKNEDENRKLKIINNFIAGLDGLEDLVAIQKVRFMQITSGLLYVDMATGELKINKEMFIAL